MSHAEVYAILCIADVFKEVCHSGGGAPSIIVIIDLALSHVSKKLFLFQYSALKKSLPDNIHLLTLEYLEKDKILLRLDHQFEASDPVGSDDVTVSLSVSILSVSEIVIPNNSDVKCLYLQYGIIIM